MPLIPIPYFDRALIEVDDAGDTGGTPLTEAEVTAALSRFLALGAENRLSDSRHLLAYYMDFRQAIGSSPWLDEEVGDLVTPDAIWSHVTPNSIFLQRGNGDDRHCYVVLKGECAWEGRGLMLVWRDGGVLCKAGGYDGLVTNASAYGDQSLADVVYNGSDVKFRTHIDR